MAQLDIVLDTNILFSGLFSQKGSSFGLISDIGTGKFNLHVSVPLIFEYEDVLKRNQAELGLTSKDIDDFIEFICSVSIPHFLYFSWRPCLNDPNDDMILELAIAANAKYIVTHNIRHFKHIHGFDVRPIKPGDFLKLLEE